MRSWLAFVIRSRLLEIALAVSLGIAAYEAARRLSETTVSVLSQHIGRDPQGEDARVADLFYAPYYLYINVADTYIVYGQVLIGAIALALLTVLGVLVIRRRDRELGECPFCASRIPYESTHCAYCGSGVSPGEPYRLQR